MYAVNVQQQISRHHPEPQKCDPVAWPTMLLVPCVSSTPTSPVHDGDRAKRRQRKRPTKTAFYNLNRLPRVSLSDSIAKFKCLPELCLKRCSASKFAMEPSQILHLYLATCPSKMLSQPNHEVKLNSSRSGLSRNLLQFWWEHFLALR